MIKKMKYRPNRALLFVNLGHFLNHVIMLIYPTVALTLVDIWSVSYGELFKLFFYGIITLWIGCVTGRVAG